MTRKPPSNLHEFAEFLIRRRNWIIWSLVIVPPLVAVVGRHWPKTFRSETTILIDPQRVPEQYVKATVTGSINDRLQTLSDEVMSRTRLLTIANEDHLYQKEREKHGDEAALAAIRKDIKVTLIKGEGNGNPIEGFKIAYLASSPELAQKVTQQITDLFIEENVKQRDQDAEGTELFIKNQLAQAGQQLALQDQKIRDFKAAHLGELPEQENANLAMIGEYQSLAQQNSDAIDRANQQKVYLQSMLNVSNGNKPLPSAAPLTPLQKQLQAAENQLEIDRQKYTDAYPDVIRLRDQIATLEREIKNQPPQAARAALAASSTNGNAALDMEKQLESQLRATEQEISAREVRQRQIESKISALQSKVQSLPAVQQEYESLSRNYKEMQDNYNSLLQKEQASAMAAQLELHNESERFQVLDPASFPTQPYSPNLRLVYTGGLLGGLLVGLGLAFLKEMRDPSIHNSDEAEMYLSAPLIATLPAIQIDKALPAQGRKFLT